MIAGGTFRHILTGVDFSEASFQALAVALALAQESGGHLRVLHVLEGFPGETVYSGSRAFRMLDDFQARVTRVNQELQALIPAGARQSADIEVQTLSGRAHERILAAVADRPTDLIVLGRSTRSRLEQLVAGSTARRVLRRAASPVLLVPAASVKDVAVPTTVETVASGECLSF